MYVPDSRKTQLPRDNEHMLTVYKLLLTLMLTVATSTPFVISEVLWVGSPVSTADEWIELQLHPTFTGALLRLEGYEIWTNTSSSEPKRLVAFGSGDVLYAGSPYIVANYSAVNSALQIEPNLVTTDVSLLNSKLLLWIQTASGTIIDMVDDGVGEPFAGGKTHSGTVFASMERIDVTVAGTEPTNWVTAQTSINIDSGALVFATPGVAYTSQSSSSSSSTTSSGSSTPSSSTSSSQSSAPSSQLYISELLPNPAGSDEAEWIEIATTGSEAVLIGNLQFMDTSGKQTTLTLSGATHLLPNTYTVFTKAELGFTLKNSSGTVQLLHNDILQDSLTYPEVVEAVSFGRASSGSLVQPYCAPTPGAPNVTTAFEPLIEWQNVSGQFTASGTLVATGALTANIKLSASGTTLNSASCQVTFSDGWQSASCNPPSHTVPHSGTGQIAIHITNYCGTTVQHIVDYIIYKANTSGGGNAQNSTQNIEHKCSSITTSGVRISEAFMNPIGDEKVGEWIELWNQNSHSVSLCGWQLDDSEGGSKPYDLREYNLAPNTYLVIPRTQSAIALNNSNESVRLFAPLNTEGSVQLVDVVEYGKSTEGESLALREDGHYVWTPFTTPGAANQFRSVERRFATDTVVLNAALPNPDGKDSKATEWVEITNVSDMPVEVTGWQLDDKPGGSAPYVLPNLWLDPAETKRFMGNETGIELANSYDEARLLDPDGYTNSVFSWEDAVSGYIYRLPRVRTEKVWAKVVQCIDGDTLKIAFDEPDELRLLPDDVERAWLATAEDPQPAMTLRLLGVDTPETVHPFKPLEAFGLEASAFTCSKVNGKRVQLQFDEEVWDKYNRLLGYVFIHDELLQAQLLQAGLATVYTKFPFARKAAFIAYEAEARAALLGMWSKAEVVALLQEQKEQDELIEQVLREGLQLHFDPPSGRVQFGSGVRIISSVPAEVFVSVNSGAYVTYVEPLSITGTTVLQAYATFTASGQLIRSGTGQAIYALEQSEYDAPVYISEVYPAPGTNEEEWIELYNPSTEPVDIGGFMLDDALGKGSKPHVLPLGTVLKPGQVLVLPKTVTALSLSNNGDEVHVLDPNGTVIHSVQFAKFKKATSLVSNGTTSCVSDVASPGTIQSCITLSSNNVAIDRDGDGLPDDHEEFKYHTDPLNRDTDGDGYFDGFEVQQELDPLVPTEPVRPVQLLYKKFIQKNVSVKFAQYKTVPDKLTITNKLPFTITVAFAGNEFTAPPDSKLKHELKLSEVGEYLVGVQLPHSLRSFDNFDSILLNTIFIQKTKSSSKFSLPSWAKFTQKYLFDVSKASSDEGRMNELQKQIVAQYSAEAPKKYSLMLYILCLMLLLTVVCILRFKN